MIIHKLKDSEEFIAGDESILRQLLHPDTHGMEAGFSLAHAIVKIGKKTLPHKLKSLEVYYIANGKGLMHINDESQTVEPGDTIYIPPHSVQYIENIGTSDLIFLCLVSPAWKEEDEEII